MFLTVLVDHVAVKVPQATIRWAKILLFDPPSWFIGVASFSPPPQRRPKIVVNVLEGSITHNVPVIICPTTNEWIKLSDQLPSGALGIGFDDLAQVHLEGFDALVAGFDE